MRLEVKNAPYAVQTLALHYLGPGRGEKSLVLLGILVVEVGCHHQVEHGVAQILEPLVVHPLAACRLHGHGAVHEGQLVECDVARVEACDAMYKNVKLLILGEKELYE